MPKCFKCGDFEQHATNFNKNVTRAQGVSVYCRVHENQDRREKYARKRAERESKAPTPTAPIHTAPVAKVAPPEPEQIPAEQHVQNARSVNSESRKLRELRMQNQALLAANDKLSFELEEAVRMMAPLTATPMFPRVLRGKYDAVPCAVGSDWHVDELVTKAQTMGLNEYNPTIARIRARHFFQNFLKLSQNLAQDCNVTELYMAFIGDLFSGWIHESLMTGASTAMAPGDAAHFAQELLADGIMFLLENSPYTLIGDMIPGNHGRLTDKMHFADPTGTSLETLAYRMLAARFANEPRVQLRVADSGEVHRPFFERFKMRLVHGYEIRYQGGVGGLTIPMNKRLLQWNRSLPCDLTVIGHWHTLFQGPDFQVNGSLIGYNSYAKVNGFAFEEPRQAFFAIHRRNGGERSVTAPIWLDDAHKLELSEPDFEITEG